MRALKYIGLVIFFLSHVATDAQIKSSPDYRLTGTAKGISDGEVELSSYNSKDRTSTVMNTGKMKNGKFVLTGKLKGPEMMSLLFKEGNWSMQVFVENSSIGINVDTTGSEHYDYTRYGDKKGARLKRVKISGSLTQADFESYENNAAQKSYMDKMMEINKRYQTEKSEDKKEVIKMEMEPLRKRNSEWQWNYIRQFQDRKPSSVAGVYMLSNYYMFNSETPIAEMDQLLAKYTGAAKESIYFLNLGTEMRG